LICIFCVPYISGIKCGFFSHLMVSRKVEHHIYLVSRLTYPLHHIHILIHKSHAFVKRMLRKQFCRPKNTIRRSKFYRKKSILYHCYDLVFIVSFDLYRPLDAENITKYFISTRADLSFMNFGRDQDARLMMSFFYKLPSIMQSFYKIRRHHIIIIQKQH